MPHMEETSHSLGILWPQQCSLFNHGWLRNCFSQSLGAAIQISRGNVQRDLPSQDHQTWVSEWLSQEDTARRLIDSFVTEMSPTVLFSVSPLTALHPEDAEFFRDMAHTHWLKRHHIEERIECAKIQLVTAGELVRKLGRVKDIQEAIGSGLLHLIHAACQELADALSQLPRSIQL